MEASHDVQQVRSNKDQQNHIMLKGKRTKRQRPQSPIPFTLVSANTRDDMDDYYSTGEDKNNNTNLSHESSADQFYQDSTEEEEDMAYCLILLAQGHHSRQPQPVKQLDEDAKFTSRRYLEAASGTGGSKAGYYVYECKTCGRTFPSFQALGGHRASHKKPKNIAAAEERRQLMILSSSSYEDPEFKTSSLPSPLSLQLSNRELYSSTSNNKSSKSHECAICGAEFTSGQALGGHMRRHRGAVNVVTNTSTALSLTPLASDSEELPIPKKPRNVLSLELDLNLPAPENDHHQRELKFPFASNQQQPQNQQQQPQQKQQQQQPQQKQQQQQTNLVLSSAKLVDCHN